MPIPETKSIQIGMEAHFNADDCTIEGIILAAQEGIYVLDGIKGLSDPAITVSLSCYIKDVPNHLRHMLVGELAFKQTQMGVLRQNNFVCESARTVSHPSSDNLASVLDGAVIVYKDKKNMTLVLDLMFS